MIKTLHGTHMAEKGLIFFFFGGGSRSTVPDLFLLGPLGLVEIHGLRFKIDARKHHDVRSRGQLKGPRGVKAKVPGSCRNLW